MLKILVTLVIILVLALVIWRMVTRGLSAVWQGLHRVAGIEVGTPRHSLPATNTPSLGYQADVPIPNTFGSDERYQLVARTQEAPTWRTKHGKVSSMPQLAGVTVERLNRMPTEAVVILDRIHDKLTRYQAWRQQQTDQQTALNEKQFVIDRLIHQTLPDAVNQYDQLARFNPYQLQQPIHDTLTAGDMLIAVLQRVDGELDALLQALNAEVSRQLATTYHYVKARTQ